MSDFDLTKETQCLIVSEQKKRNSIANTLELCPSHINTPTYLDII